MGRVGRLARTIAATQSRSTTGFQARIVLDSNIQATGLDVAVLTTSRWRVARAWDRHSRVPRATSEFHYGFGQRRYAGDVILFSHIQKIATAGSVPSKLHGSGFHGRWKRATVKCLPTGDSRKSLSLLQRRRALPPHLVGTRRLAAECLRSTWWWLAQPPPRVNFTICSVIPWRTPVHVLSICSADRFESWQLIVSQAARIARQVDHLARDGQSWLRVGHVVELLSAHLQSARRGSRFDLPCNVLLDVTIGSYSLSVSPSPSPVLPCQNFCPVTSVEPSASGNLHGSLQAGSAHRHSRRSTRCRCPTDPSLVEEAVALVFFSLIVSKSEFNLLIVLPAMSAASLMGIRLWGG